MKAWCIWCESPQNSEPKNGYYWIHNDCANKLMDIKSNLDTILEILNGMHRRNKNNPQTEKVDLVIKYISDMQEFDRKWNNTMKLIKQIKHKEGSEKVNGFC